MGHIILIRYIFGYSGMRLNLKFLSLNKNGKSTNRLSENLKKMSIDTGTSGPRIFTNTLIKAKKNADVRPKMIPCVKFCSTSK